MKKLLFVLFTFALSLSLNAKQGVTFEWDLSPDTDVIKYVLYRNGLPMHEAALPPITDNPPAGVHKYVVTAVNGAGLESLPSNEVTVIVPNGPVNLRVKVN